MSDLYCFNPLTAKRDGKYCKWQGAGKCLKCQAADRIKELEAKNAALEEEVDWFLSHVGIDRHGVFLPGGNYGELDKAKSRKYLAALLQGDK